jgi:hypothetical protein
MVEIKKKWSGFVPQQYSHSQEFCAYYHCPKGRLDYRRYCQEHARIYDSEAVTTKTKILSLF